MSKELLEPIPEGWYAARLVEIKQKYGVVRPYVSAELKITEGPCKDRIVFKHFVAQEALDKFKDKLADDCCIIYVSQQTAPELEPRLSTHIWNTVSKVRSIASDSFTLQDKE